MSNNQTGIKDSTFVGNPRIEIRQEINVPRQNQSIPSNVRQGSKNFVGREEELEGIHAILLEGQGVIVCAVEGMGGVGKTELALQYATRYQQEYVARYWLSLREMELNKAVVTMASPYLDLPESMLSASLDAQAAWCWQNWLPKSGKLLVILDDVPKAESIPDLAMPIDPRVRILVTTRERELNVGFESVPLKVLSEEKALELLRKIVGAAKIDRELVTVKEICITLGYLPLGIELIGEYLSKNRFLTFAKLQERLNLADESISRERKHRFYAHRGVEAAIQMSWDDISTGSQRVAMLLGLFAPVEILWELVAEIGASAEITEDELNEARGQLDRLHLIQPIDEECNFYKIHTLVREFFRAKLLKAEENHQFRQAFVNSLLAIAKEITETPTLDLIARIAPAIPHLDMLSREMLDDIPNPKENLTWTFVGTARFYQGQGLYEIAEESFQKCLQVTEKRLGKEHPATSTSLNNLAGLYELQGNYSKAEPLFLQSIKIDECIYGEEHIEVAVGFNNLASLYKLQGRYNEAEISFLKSIKILEKYSSAPPCDIASFLNNLAGLYELQGRYSEAEQLAVRALEIAEKQLGSEHPYTAFSLNNLAEIYRSQRSSSKAEPLYKRALTITEKLFGMEHLNVAIILNNLALLYCLQKRYDEAEILRLRCLKIEQQFLENDHPQLATSFRNLAELYTSQGKYCEAENLHVQALSIRKKKLGKDHPDIAESLQNLAELYQIQGKYDKAESFYMQSLEIRERVLGREHPDVANCLNNLAILYMSQENYYEAEPLFVKALEIFLQTFGQDHPNTKTVEISLMLLRLQIATGMSSEILQQTLLSNPDALTQLLQQMMLDNDYVDNAD